MSTIYDPREQFNRCYIEALSMNESMLSTLTLPFAQFSGAYDIKYMACAVPADPSHKTELYLETDLVRRGHLQSRLEQCGASGVVVHSFPHNDADRLAGKFLGRVLKLAGSEGMTLYVRGETKTVSPSGDASLPEPDFLVERRKEQLEEEERDWAGDCDGSVGKKRKCGNDTTVAHTEDLITIIEILSERAHRFELRMLASEAQLATKEAELGARLLVGVEQQAVASDESPASAIASLKAEHARKIESLVAEHNRCRAVFEHDVQRHNETFKKVNRLGEMYREEIRKATAKVRKECQAKLDCALAPRTPAEARVRELESLVQQLRTKAEADAVVMTSLREEMERGDGGGDSGSDDEEEEMEEDGDEDYGNGTSVGGMGRSQLKRRVVEQDAVISNLKQCFANASRMRHEAWTTRDEARARCAELEKELRDKELDAKLEIDRLKDSLKHSDEALQRERVLRRREAQGEILHEEGKVLIRCTKCYEFYTAVAQYVEDPFAHVAEAHATTNIHRRSVACPLGCGTVLTPRYNDPTVPQSEVDQHTHGAKCCGRMELLRSARAARESYVVRRAQEEAAAGYEFEREQWGW